MRTLEVTISEETARRLETLADKHGLSAEDFVRQVTEETVDRSDEEFDKATRRVLTKNEELYRRLAI